ncbi:hypothetical protein [Paenibacillus terrigena]|uniref:hypothetical protein n=1 Tax=Paenibacillus terrigena TaxID=369333 RepID=UPI0028D475FC|nr:hypothetical protein [Paenibacillus terrigena]
MNEVDRALQMQMDLLQESEQIAHPDGYVHEEIAECLLLLGHGHEAEHYFARAYEVLSQDLWLTQQEPERLARMKLLARQLLSQMPKS